MKIYPISITQGERYIVSLVEKLEYR